MIHRSRTSGPPHLRTPHLRTAPAGVATSRPRRSTAAPRAASAPPLPVAWPRPTTTMWHRRGQDHHDV